MKKKGTVLEVLKNSTFRILNEEGIEVRAYLSGKMRLHKIKVIVGDKVEYLIDEYGPNNRITKRG